MPGAVPIKATTPAERQQVWDSWRIKIGGLVDKPMEITLDQLMALPQRQIPVLLVCAGNRRKEQNMVRRVRFMFIPSSNPFAHTASHHDHLLRNFRIGI